ncbi:MAG: rod-binding protein [Candidatus Hydrogenedentes bacterium]|nr:rod-binding protein [Candidatus Hydrogenedentota bacterium]
MLYVNPLAERLTPLGRDGDIASTRQRQVLQEFERLLIYQMLEEMRKTVPANGLFGHSSAMDFYEEVQDDFLAGQMAASGQLGVAKLLEAQLSKPHSSIPQPPNSGVPFVSPLQSLPFFPLPDLRNPPALPINKPAASGLPLRRVES